MAIIAVNEVVKRPNTKSDYDGKDLDDLARCIADPLYFMRTFMMVQHPIKGALPFVPYECQERIINGIHEHRFTCVITARQQGKCSTFETNISTDGVTRRIGDLLNQNWYKFLINMLEKLLVRLANHN